MILPNWLMDNRPGYSRGKKLRAIQCCVSRGKNCKHTSSICWSKSRAINSGGGGAGVVGQHTTKASARIQLVLTVLPHYLSGWPYPRMRTSRCLGVACSTASSKLSRTAPERLSRRAVSSSNLYMRSFSTGS